jgi:hypothetical protein
MKHANKASRQLFARLLAIDDGGMEIAKEASRYLSAWLLAISKSRNEYCHQSIWTLVCSPACYWYEWKSSAKHPDKSLLDSLLLMTKEWKSLTKHPDIHQLACWQAKVWMNLSTKHPDTHPLNCWLFGEGKMTIANKASRQSSAQLLAIDDGGMNITEKASGHLSAWLLAISEG